LNKNYFFEDRLVEGDKYTYICKALVEDLEIAGANSVQAETLTQNPPNFTGIQGVVAASASSVTVSWGEVTGRSVAINRYEVFANPGTVLDTSLEPKQVVSYIARSAVVANLGEEVPYVFAVRACTVQGICAWNYANNAPIITINSGNASSTTKSFTILDSGAAPTTVGATAAIIEGGIIKITAPWSAAQGGLYKRHVYYKQGTPVANTAPCVPDIKAVGCYTGQRTIKVSEFANPPTLLSVTSLANGEVYSFVVRDEDPAGHFTTNFATVTISTPDAIAPVFLGGGTLSAGTPAVTVISLSFTAIIPQTSDINGASNYLVYLTEAAELNTPADACVSGALYSQITAADYTAGQTVTLNIPGRISRKTYGVCVKARDDAGNVSNTTTPALPNLTTQDLTAPDLAAYYSLGKW
jgi:hypothetical protein